MMKIFAKVAYKGTNYFGWQKQPNAKTIQGEIESVLSKILNRPVSIYGSGRTDAGVHALSQTFHFEIDFLKMDFDRLKYSINCLLSEDIKILELKEISEDFHSRFSLKSKTYLYKINLGERDVFNYEFSYCVPYKINLDIFKKSLSLFEGTHNFSSFTSKEEDESNFIRTINHIKIEKKDNELSIYLNGNGFMRYMVRNIIGTALAVSSGKENLAFISTHLDNKTREIVSYKAPSNGLFLKEVIY